jgi:hypothetical protein
MRYLILFIFLSGVWGYAQTPVLNQEKYEYYRTRLKSQFMLYSGDATIKGSHLPMESLVTDNRGNQTGYWADAVWWLGHYVAMLSIEYKLLQNNNLHTSQTLDELRLAIAVYERLDYNAERCWGGADTLNGFFLRDDVDGKQAAQFRVNDIRSDYKYYCGQGSNRNAPSQDQLWGCYLGFALLLKLVDDEPLKAEVRSLARRMISVMQHVTAKGKEVWEIVNPVTGEVVQKRGDIQWMCYAHRAIEEYLTGDTVTFGKSNGGFWKSMWSILKNNILINKNGNFVWYGVLACSAVMNDRGASEKNCYDWLVRRCGQIAKKRPDLQQSLIFPHLPLIAAILHGYSGKNSQPAAQDETYLNSAPFEGAFHTDSDGLEQRSAVPWHSLSLFCPWHISDKGYFNMLDYMLLYNSYQLVYRSGLDEFRAFAQSAEPL